VDSRIRTLRECAEYLSGPHGGDREIGCLEASVRAALELIADMLAARDAPAPRGYKDACDKLCEYGVCDRDLAERLKEVFDIAERAPTAWSSLEPGDLGKAREQGARSMLELADAFERLGAQAPAPATS
jgi:hypothetical protein